MLNFFILKMLTVKQFDFFWTQLNSRISVIVGMPFRGISAQKYLSLLHTNQAAPNLSGLVIQERCIMMVQAPTCLTDDSSLDRTWATHHETIPQMGCVPAALIFCVPGWRIRRRQLRRMCKKALVLNMWAPWSSCSLLTISLCCWESRTGLEMEQVGKVEAAVWGICLFSRPNSEWEHGKAFGFRAPLYRAFALF